MKRIFGSSICVLLVAMLAIATVANAAEKPAEKLPEEEAPPSIQTDQPVSIALSSKVPIKFYGFISAEFMYSNAQLSSFGALNNTPASYNRNMTGFNRVVDESVDGNNDAFISATVQNTRFGFVLDPYDFNGKNFSVDARLEMDFFSTADFSIHSVRPRIRRAYAGIGQRSWRVLIGQEWDVYSPINTATLNIGGNLWQQGNMGFRRPQIRFTYENAIWNTSGIQFVASVNLPGNSMAFNDNGNTTCIPMEQGRIGFWRELPAGKLWAYLSAVYARHKNATVGQSDVNNWGIALSLDVPVHKFFKASGEVQYGYSLGSLLSISSDTMRQKFVSGWGQIKSNWLKWFETNAGYGIADLNDSQVLAGWVSRNQMGFFNAKFKPFKVLVIGLEYNYMRTNYKGSGASTANAVLTNVIFYF